MSAYEVHPDQLEYIPIGNPYKNISFYILNKHHEEVKTGEVGELYIAGIQNMKGYCNDQELTKKVLHFVNGQLVYKTSDMVFINEKHECIFWGRSDDMIKRGGKRVYISEIENIVRSVINVIDSACICITVATETVVIGFVVQKNIGENEIEKYLTNQYPTYLIPDNIFEIDIIPKTLIGKIDKKKLLAIYNLRMGKAYENN